MHTKEEKMEAFGRLLDIMDDLREKCPWDRVQTRESLRTNTIEETFELSEAILKDHPEEIKKELGDLLLHIVFYAKIGQEKGEYDIKDVCDALCEKLIYRHPHVYGTTDVQGSTSRVEQNWEQLKLKEKDGNRTVLDGVPTSLPALIKAYRMQDKARNVGFDWERREQVWDKVSEELGELRAELDRADADASEAEMGDFLFSVINAARLYGINPDNALERTNAKFRRRFVYLEAQTSRRGRSLKARTLAEIGGIVRTSTDWSSARAFSEAIWPLNMTACSHALRLTTATVSEQSRIRSLPNMFQ